MTHPETDLIAQAKARLPLPALMAQCGHGDRAKKSARCMFHEDSRSSFSTYQRPDGAWAWKCWAGCGEGDEPDWLAKHRGLSNADACREFIKLAGVTPSRPQSSTQSSQPPFDWPACVAALTPDHRAKLAAWRGYAPDFIEWLHAQNLVGLFHGERIAFPVHDASGQVISCHYRVASKQTDKVYWYFFPTGLGTRPLVIGQPLTAGSILIFESQWDAFAVMDKLGWHTPDGVPDAAIIVTRGAANGKLAAGLCAPTAAAYVFPQNDPPDPKNGRIPAEEWFKDLCAGAGSTVLRVVTPAPHDDPNVWTKAGATADDLWQAIRAAKPVAAAPDNSVSHVSIPDTDDTEEPPPKPFPLDSLPPIAAAIVTEVARVERNPPILAACAALATMSAAIGSGLEVVTGPNRLARGNLYILGTAPSGAGKSRAFDLICKPFLDAQRDLMTNWQKDIAPGLEADIEILGQRVEQLKAQARKAESDEERAQLRDQLQFPKAQLRELTKQFHLPRWSTEDVTIEALADLLDQNDEVIFSMSADGRKVADNLLGRMNPNKRVDDSLYLKGFTGDRCTVDRKDKSPTILNHPCIGILWFIQPDILDDLVAERSLMQGGFLPRALTCHTRTKRQKIGVAAIAPISETAQADWNRLISELHTTYHQPGVRHVIQCSEAALQRLNAHFDQTVDQGNGELADMESCVARWTEQAWHLSVVLHAGLWGKDAHHHTLALETAEAAIAIADWFAGQQKDVLARGLHEARKKSEDRVLDLLDERWERSKLDYITHRDVQRGLNTRDADEARGLLARMETGGVLVSEPLRRPEGGHVERRYRLKTGRNPVPG